MEKRAVMARYQFAEWLKEKGEDLDKKFIEWVNEDPFCDETVLLEEDVQGKV